MREAELYEAAEDPTRILGLVSRKRTHPEMSTFVDGGDTIEVGCKGKGS